MSMMLLNKVRLKEGQIQNVATQFDQQVENAQKLFQLKWQMSVDDFRDWINIAEFSQMLQRALAYGKFNKTGTYCQASSFVKLAISQGTL